ncbi:hypothetical protein NM688_g3445 [Phlebia brevispora]|uniref:Uncharacterized protein n=1 Tax=Phlebia brevispora TaxID=194682 RepID=A0ACC1T5X7_9APHY|nr:hypothetical protein NM688_g3445 [Phlebia brevispora]
MPSAPVNSDGALMYYEDSGVPPGSEDYVTVVLIHGLVLHGATFYPTFPYAKSRGLRFIAPNLRDYPNSTPYTPSEFENLCSADVETQKLAVRSLGLELAAFLKYIVDAESLPPKRGADGQVKGGLVLLSWSMGNLWSLSMFGNASALEDETRAVLRRYLRTYIMHEPPYFGFGLTVPEELSFRPLDQTEPLEERGAMFCRAAGMFYPPLPELSDHMSTLFGRVPLQSGSRSMSTWDRYPQEVQAAIADYDALQRTGRYLRSLDTMLWSEITNNMLRNLEGDFADVSTVVFWCDMSHSLCPFGIKCFADRVAATAAGRDHIRKVAFVKISGANHTVHLEDPEGFVELISNAVQ